MKSMDRRGNPDRSQKKQKTETGEISDSALIEQLQHDKQALMTELYKRYQHRLYQHVFAMLKEPQIAQDTVQDAFERLSKQTLTPDFKIQAWLSRVATNLVYNITRDSKRRNRIFESYSQQAPTSSDPSAADRTMDEKHRASLVREAIAELDDVYRLPLEDQMAGMSYIEIAKKQQIELGTVMSRLSRARAQIKEKLKKFNFTNFNGENIALIDKNGRNKDAV